MLTVRCMSCQTVFQTDARSPHANVRCPSCGATHRLAALETSTAGDSMMITAGQLKQVLESPKGPGAHQRSEPVILCPSCKVRLYVNRKKYGGKRVHCPACKQAMVIPRLSKEIEEPKPVEEEKPNERDDAPNE